MNAERFLQNLSNILRPFMGELGESLTTALNRPTRVQLGEIHPVDMEELGENYPGEAVLTHATFVTGVSHDAIYLVPVRWAAAWADLMVMGDGSAQFDPTLHLDAVKELLNQVSGSLGQYLTSAAGFPVQIRAAAASLENVPDQTASVESYFSVDFQVRSKDMDQALLTLLLSPEVVQELQKIQPLQRKASMDDRPPPAVLEDEPELDEAPEVRSAKFEDFGAAAGSGAGNNIEILMDLELPVIIELGRTAMFIRDILELGPGSIVELTKLSGEPVDLYVNDKKFAQGEVVVIDENFGIRITDLVKVEDRIRSLR